MTTSEVSAFAAACHAPFANGTEGDWWDSCWCQQCARDHAMHGDGSEGDYCSLPLACYAGEWPEGWLPKPDDGRPFSATYPVCTAFIPCEKCGSPMNLRRGKRGLWLGCSTFPKCKSRLAWSKVTPSRSAITSFGSTSRPWSESIRAT